MKVGFAFNQKKEADSEEPPDDQAEFDSPETIHAIKNALESLGHEVVMIEADHNALSKLHASRPDIVFNIAEGLGGECRESQIPILCEMLGIPYTGSGPLALAITLDKAKTKEILSCYGIATPKFQVFTKPGEPLDPRLRFPFIVKPNCEGSSKGITNDCLVRNEEELREKLRQVTGIYRQPALVEEFLEGREFTVSLIGNGNPEILPIVEVCFDCLPEGINRFDSYEVKWKYDSPDSGYDLVKCPADIPEQLEKEIKKVCIEAYRALGCRDFSRIDLRLDSKGAPNIIEVNALAGLIPDPMENSRFPKSCYAAGMSYTEIIGRILQEGIKRMKASEDAFQQKKRSRIQNG